MARSQNEFVREVLGRLGALAIGQTPSAEDDVLIKARLADKLDELEDEDLITFDIADGIPNKHFIPLSYLVAIELLDHFGCNAEIMQKVAAGAARADRTMRRQKQNGAYESAPARPDYF